MGVVADAVLAAGGRVVGVIPGPLATSEVAHGGLTELHVVPGMHERKALMAAKSDGFLAMPGGVGTFEELFEIVTWSALGLIDKPIGLLNVAGYFDPMLAMLDHAVAERFVRPEHLAMLVVSDRPESIAADLLRHRAPAPTPGGSASNRPEGGPPHAADEPLLGHRPRSSRPPPGGPRRSLYPRLPATIPIHWNIRARSTATGRRRRPCSCSRSSWSGCSASSGSCRALAQGLRGRIGPADVCCRDGRRPRPLRVPPRRDSARDLAARHEAPHPIDIGRAIFAGMFLFLALIGNVLGKVRRNRLIGVRVPWTLASDRVWDDTHRVAAWSTVVGGADRLPRRRRLVFRSSSRSRRWPSSFVVPVVYSYVLSRRLRRRGAL